MLLARIEISNDRPDKRRNGINEVKGKKVRREMVAEIDKPNIADTLAGRSEAELRDIVSRANFLLGNSQNEPTPATNSAKAKGKDDSDTLQTLYAGFGEVIASAEGGKPIPLPILLRGKYGSLFRKAASRLDRLTREDFKATLPVERLKIARLVVGLAAREIEAKGKTVSISSLLVVLSNPAGVVDSAFPFYRASGLLPMITRRKAAK